jgi:ubiquinone/menaquinone biosynthesis C-methylase UbiE
MKTNIQKQYNDFSNIYSENIDYDKVSNEKWYSQIDFDITNKKLLDVGCGDGKDLKILSSKGAVIYGVEPSNEFVNTAKENNPDAIIKEGIAENIPFSENMFDIVVSKWTLQTCTDVPKALNEINRVLKPGGYFILLSKHPYMQFLEKLRNYGNGSNYYEQKIVTSNIYEGKIKLKEPSHTMQEYLNSEFLNNFDISYYYEGFDFPASEQFDNNIYPTYFIIKARKR